MKKPKGRVRVVVQRGPDRRVVFDQETDASQEAQLRKRAEKMMGSGNAVMSISRSNKTEKEVDHAPAS
jgi:hypothetical protein